jgi:hypothetical protein
MPCAPIDLGKADHSAAVRARGALQVITEQWATPGNAKNDRPAGSAQLNRPATHCGGGTTQFCSARGLTIADVSVVSMRSLSLRIEAALTPTAHAIPQYGRDDHNQLMLLCTVRARCKSSLMRARRRNRDAQAVDL